MIRCLLQQLSCSRQLCACLWISKRSARQIVVKVYVIYGFNFVVACCYFRTEFVTRYVARYESEERKFDCHEKKKKKNHGAFVWKTYHLVKCERGLLMAYGVVLAKGWSQPEKC